MHRWRYDHDELAEGEGVPFEKPPAYLCSYHLRLSLRLTSLFGRIAGMRDRARNSIASAKHLLTSEYEALVIFILVKAIERRARQCPSW